MSSQNGSDAFTTKQAAKYKAANADYPLRWHPRGGWCKKIRGRVTYWGKVTPDEALERYLHERDYIERGELAPAYDPTATTVKELCNEFLAKKETLIESGELTQRTWDDYKRTCGYLLKHFGHNRSVANLRPVDFVAFRNYLARGRGVVALSHEINRCRGVFKFAYESDLVPVPVRYGSNFDRPRKGKIRAARQANGRQDFLPEEVNQLLDATQGQLHAMLLLGVNTGLGNADLCRLDASMIDMKGGWLDYPRPKTGAMRRAPLWKETVAALQPFVDGRTEGRVFTTRFLNAWTPSAITHEFRKVLVALEMTKTQRNFYGLRRTFRTIADECGDNSACDVIMGHTNDKSMGQHYNQIVADDRLLKVSNHARKRVLIDGKPKTKGKSRKAVAK